MVERTSEKTMATIMVVEEGIGETDMVVTSHTVEGSSHTTIILTVCHTGTNQHGQMLHISHMDTITLELHLMRGEMTKLERAGAMVPMGMAATHGAISVYVALIA